MPTLTKEQLSEVMCEHVEKENGLHDLLEIMLESLMVAERGEILREQEDRNKGTDTGLAIPTATEGSLSSGYRVAVSATFTRRSWPSFGTRKSVRSS